ncbi:MAG: hypothetical protein Q6360_13110 [Candidatus Brocadiales bacterium]|nr:hypothetical protein [Candidatus Brocadiales bacterium]
MTNIEQALQQTLGKDQTLEARTLAATAPFQNQLRTLDARIAGFDAASLRRQEEALKSGDTLRYSTGLAGQVARTDAIERLTLLAQRQAISGDIASAESTAKISVDAQFAQQEQNNAVLRQNIVDNYDNFTTQQKKRADAALLKLDKDDAFVSQQKIDRLAIQNIALKAAEFTADSSAVAKIQKASTPEEALAAATPYLQNPKAKLELESARLDILIKRKELEAKGQPTKEEIKQEKADQQARETEMAKAQQALTVINQLRSKFVRPAITSGGTVTSSGERAVGPLAGRVPTFRKETADFERAHEQLKALLSLDNYKLLKGTGQISNYEGQLLSNAATQLDLKMSEKSYQAELTKLEQAFDSVLSKSSTLSTEDASLVDEFFNPSGSLPTLAPANYFRN